MGHGRHQRRQARRSGSGWIDRLAYADVGLRAPDSDQQTTRYELLLLLVAAVRNLYTTPPIATTAVTRGNESKRRWANASASRGDTKRAPI